MTKLAPSVPPGKITDDGLRYVNRPAGSMFGTISGSLSRSCYWCGTHRPPSALASQRILGKSHMVCAVTCSKNPASRKKSAGADAGSAAASTS